MSGGLDPGSPRGLRLAAERVPLDPWRPIRTLRELERLPGRGGEVAPAFAVFLAGGECPFRCIFCDLWRETLDGPTPEGAIARQVEVALAELEAGDGPDALARTVVKLYNASNFFEPRAVPLRDLDAAAGLLAPARRVVVECHPRLILGKGGELCRRFASRLDGTLEVAMGLETVHPEIFPRLDKGMELPDFGRAAARLDGLGVVVRAFVLVGLPWTPPEEAVDWAVRSVEHALEAGAANVALIPLRTGGGALAGLERQGAVVEPRLDQLEEALDRSLTKAATLPGARAGSVVTADLWDLEKIADCPACFDRRRGRLERANRTGVLDGADACERCGWSPSQ